jgi:predicted nucleic acid-binding protein
MNQNRYFIDTAYLIALLNPRDAYHKKAMDMLPKLRSANEIWITEAILIEFGNSMARVNRSATVTFINSCYTDSNVRIVSIDRGLFHKAVKFYHDHDDKEWGLTDCISFVVMKENGLVEVFTADEHFLQAGFRALMR